MATLSLNKSYMAQKWPFVPVRKEGERVRAGDTIGTVKKLHFVHKIMVPFGEPSEVELTSIQRANSQSTNRSLASATPRAAGATLPCRKRGRCVVSYRKDFCGEGCANAAIPSSRSLPRSGWSTRFSRSPWEARPAFPAHSGRARRCSGFDGPLFHG